MKIIITGKPYKYITEKKITKVVNRVFGYLREKLPPTLRLEFYKVSPFQGSFSFDGHWKIGICKVPEKEFNYVLAHELVHFIDYRKRGYKIWNHSYATEDIITYFTHTYEYHAESIAVKLYPVPYFVKRLKKIKERKRLNEQKH